MTKSEEKKIRISYIMATKNRAKFLPKAFKNIREFYDKNKDELIIVDGASTDGTIELIENNRDIITIFISEPDLGEAHAFNKALLLSKGEIIKALTDDDYFYPDKMRETIEYMLERPEIDALLCTGYTELHLNGQVIRGQKPSLPDTINYADDITNMFRYNCCGLGLLFRKRILSKIGLFDISFTAVDVDIIARMIENKVNLKYHNVYLYRTHTHEDSGGIARSNNVKKNDYNVLLRNKKYAYALKLWLKWNIIPKLLTPKKVLKIIKKRLGAVDEQ